jgi:hypothetical protein
MAAGKQDEAYTLTGTLLRMSPSAPTLLMARAKCLYLMGNVESAVKVRTNDSNCHIAFCRLVSFVISLVHTRTMRTCGCETAVLVGLHSRWSGHEHVLLIVVTVLWREYYV